MSGTGKWFLIGVFALYGFIIWALVSALAWFLGASPASFWAAMICCLIFYFVFILAWYRKKEELYRTANLSHWVDNITFLNDKGTVSIRQDRITEIIDLNASVDDITKITKKDPEFLRIKTALISDARKMKEEPGFDLQTADDDSSVDEVLKDIKELDEKKLSYIASGEKDPLQFKYKYFRIINIVKPHNEWISMISRREIDADNLPLTDENNGDKRDYDNKDDNNADVKKKENDNLVEEMHKLESNLASIEEKIADGQKQIEEKSDKGKTKEVTKLKKWVVELVGEETNIKDKINSLQMQIKTKGYYDPGTEKPPAVIPDSDSDKEMLESSLKSKKSISDDDDDDDEDKEEIKLEKNDDGSDDSIEVDDDSDDDDEKNEDEFSTSSELEDEYKIVDFEDDDQASMLDSYQKVSRLSSHRIIGKFADFVDKLKSIGKEDDAYDANIYRSVSTDDILRVFDNNAIVTIEDLRNCDKLKIAKFIGFTADEMKEFVKYCEEETKKKTIGFWKDLIPSELRKFNIIKLAHVQQKTPEKMVYLITYAEPIELVFPKKVIALPYTEVVEKPKLKDERIPVDIRMFEQAVYELPDRIESCLKFVPGGNASLFDYPVVVPLTYATFVLKGWMGTNIPVFKAIATTYDVNREIDDYKHFLSHEHVLLKAMAGYVNHIKSNTNLSSQHIDATQQEIDNMKDELEDQRQLRLRDIYFKSGGMAAPDVIDKMWGNNTNAQAPAPPATKKKINGPLIGVVIVVICIVILLGFIFGFHVA